MNVNGFDGDFVDENIKLNVNLSFPRAKLVCKIHVDHARWYIHHDCHLLKLILKVRLLIIANFFLKC